MKPLSAPVIGLLIMTGTSFKTAPDWHSSTPNTYRVLVEKLKYVLHVFDSSGERLVSYPVVFGSKDMGDKMMQGDRKTPEGIFHIICKRRHEKWNAFLSIDYPNADSYRKFNERKNAGMIPANAQIGGGIGIHGTWPHEDFAIDRYDNWTEGCISTKNNYIQEIFAMLPVGTSVEIRK
jgi:murein L,D-transpeptidase YafK